MVSNPNLFALPPGVDFATELLRGIEDRLGNDQIAIARSEIWVNTERTRRRLIEVLQNGPARLHPKIRLVTELAPLVTGLPEAVSSLRRRLELRPLISRLVELRPEFSGPSSVLDLTDSLALLLNEMADEGVPLDVLRGLDVSDASGHWATSLQFLSIAAKDGLRPERAGLHRLISEKIAQGWDKSPPNSPIFLAGSTGSRGPVLTLMEGLLKHQNGYVVLPGFDFSMEPEIWASLDKASSPEDHPQYRFRRIAAVAGTSPNSVRRWTDAAPPSAARNDVWSLALRPAPVTDGWMRDGPEIGNLSEICASSTLLEAKSPRSEASAVALILRRAAEDGKTAAVITPDRKLARRIAAALDRWGILPDDSAGLPLLQTPQGRLAAMAARLAAGHATSEQVMALLSNPVTASGVERKTHLDLARKLGLWLRKERIVSPTSDDLRNWANEFRPNAASWTNWIVSTLETQTNPNAPTLTEMGSQLFDLCLSLAAGPTQSDPGILWDDEAGKELGNVFKDIETSAQSIPPMSRHDFAAFFERLLSQAQAREATTPHPNIMIWGTLEARVQSVDIAILAGLNEATWPKLPDPDPWLSRGMRHDAGLLSPERRIGLSAHDFQSAIGAGEVVYSRAVRDEDALTVQARWLNRFTNLLAGLPDQNGQIALKEMRARGNKWIDLAENIDHAVDPMPPAPRPSPAPPAYARPRKLSVTQIQTLVRDPYAIYAKEILRLRPLESLRPKPDARLRGIALHEVFEHFVRAGIRAPNDLSLQNLAEISAKVLADVADWPADQRLWLSQILNNGPEFIAQEIERWQTADPTYFEIKGRWTFRLPSGAEFLLTGVADRLDIAADGTARIFDYKSGALPTPKQQKLYDRQLFILGLMAEEGVFSKDKTPVPPAEIAGVGYLGVGRKLSQSLARLDELPLDDARQQLIDLLAAFDDPTAGFTARSKMERTDRAGDFDHLSRRGEWDESTPATWIKVGS